ALNARARAGRWRPGAPPHPPPRAGFPAMTRRKRLAALLVLAGAPALAVFAVWLLAPRHEEGLRERFARVREGMTEAEVEAVLGPPDQWGDVIPRPGGAEQTLASRSHHPA